MTFSSLFFIFKQIDDVEKVQDAQLVKLPVEIFS